MTRRSFFAVVGGLAAGGAVVKPASAAAPQPVPLPQIVVKHWDEHGVLAEYLVLGVKKAAGNSQKAETTAT